MGVEIKESRFEAGLTIKKGENKIYLTFEEARFVEDRLSNLRSNREGKDNE